jgi:ribosomal protein S18 acetylase RimI-like enzyme
MFFLRLPVVSGFLERCGLFCRWRTGMTLDLRRLAERPQLPEGYEIVPWDPARLAEVAAVDCAAYQNTVDARLYPQYLATPEGCERMWREAFVGKFGYFDPQRTLLLMRDGRICGDVMACASSRIARDGFIGNLAVLPEHRGGTGSALLLTCLWSFREAGFERVSLAVTLENQHAYRLYSRLGFVPGARFPLVASPRIHTRALTHR